MREDRDRAVCKKPKQVTLEELVLKLYENAKGNTELATAIRVALIGDDSCENTCDTKEQTFDEKIKTFGIISVLSDVFNTIRQNNEILYRIKTHIKE